MTLILNLILPLVALFTPLFFLTITADFFSLNKITLLSLFAAVGLILVTIKGLTSKKIVIPLDLGFFSFFLASLVTTFSLFYLSPNPLHRVIGLTLSMISFAIIYFVTLTSQAPQKIVTWTINTLLVSGMATAIYSTLSATNVFSSLSNTLFNNPSFHPVGNPYFALIFLVSIIGLAFTSIFVRTGVTRIFHIVASIIILIGIASVTYQLVNQDGKIQFLPLQASWSIAVDILKFPQTALFGTSPDSYANVFTRLRPSSLNLNSDLWPIRFITANSEALTLLTTTGVLGFVLIFIASFHPLKGLAQVFKTDPIARIIFISLIINLILFLSLPTGFIGYFCLFIHLILATLHLRSRSASPTFLNIGLAASTNEIGNLKNPVLPIIFTLITLVLVSLLTLRIIPVYQASIAFKTAQDIASTNPTYSYDLQVKSANTDKYNPYYRTSLSQTYYSIVRGYVQKKELTDAEKKEALEFANQSIAEARNATSLDPMNVQTWENLANLASEYSFLEIQGASDLAIAAFNQAISLDPSNPSLRVQLGNYFFALNDFDSALKTFEIALSQKPDWDIPYLNSSKAYKARQEYTKSLSYLKEGIKYTPSTSDQAESLKKDLQELEVLAAQEASASAKQAN